MKPRLIITFSLIILIPVVTIIWLGVTLSQRERTVITDQFREISLGNLIEYNDAVTKKLENIESNFKKMNENVGYDNRLSNLPPKSNLINQFFILNTQRELIFPDPNAKGISDTERNFLSRTQTIWKSKEVFYRPDEYFQQAQTINLEEPQQQEQQVYDNLPNQEATQSVSRRQRSQNKPYSQLKQQVLLEGNITDSYTNSFNSAPLAESKMGWYTWFHGRGVNFILWKRNTNDEIVGYELNREELIKNIIDTLPTETSNSTQHFKLKNASGVLHRWGNYEPPDDQLPIASINLNAPLQSWELSCYFNDSHLAMASNKSILYNYVLGGSILGLVIMFLCVYFYRENTRQLRESSQKVNFVNQVSHELKTPLTNIRMYAELLERNLNAENHKSQKQLNVIVSESQRLSRLISNVLSFAQKDKNKLKLNIRKVDINSVVNTVVDSYSPVLARKNISIEANINDLPQIDADPDAIEQILGNLLSNVEKYVQDGGEVKINTECADKYVSVKVIDNGPGIPARQRGQIFVAFHRVSNELSDGVSGTGIGLTISKELAKMHGGDLTILDSDRGACFKLTLPV